MHGAKLDLRNGAGGAAMTILVGAATGEVSGTVRDEKGPVAQAPVTLPLEDPR